MLGCGVRGVVNVYPAVLAAETASGRGQGSRTPFTPRVGAQTRFRVRGDSGHFDVEGHCGVAARNGPPPT